ncbi:hypothetical protein [Rivularia sp. UHCC 0363]|uniref:hypothetical protein n=1 Tax=Rivularia sp. UHCC 0363 TaxID=3110244 RepID=UPI002B200ADD|nr:hypothetical protein [Rivularia sp. UHCC 0363]MEA5595670.1 hypothetical protein [Rivularia sp. UHCC 0363]
MKIPLKGLTVLCAAISLCSAYYLPSSQRPFDLIGVKFCPQTANMNGTNAALSQRELDKKYCSYEHKLLKEVWERKQFEASQPLPESSFIIRNIPSAKSDRIWYLVSPVAMGIAYLSYAKKCEDAENSAHLELERFKSTIKLYGINCREEREFKVQAVKTGWDKQRVKFGFISVEAIQDKLRRQTEIQDKTHASTLKQFTTADSEMDKKIAENLRDKHKADKESHEIRALVNRNQSAMVGDRSLRSIAQDTEKKAELLQTLKNYEGGWLHDMVIGRMPIVIYGKQGAYKSYTAACLALLKAYFQNAKLVSICDPHAHQNQDESWRYLIPMEPEVYGAHEDWEEYAQGINDAFDRWSDRTLKDSPIISIWDELTTMGVKLPGLAPELMPKIISAPRKANDNTICITHSLTNAGLGGVAGMSEAIKEGTLRLKLKANALQQPLFKGVLSGWVDGEGSEIDELPVTLPEWFRDAEIYQLLY